MILETGDNASSQTSHDIHLFLETRFKEIRRSLAALPPSWPEASAIQELTNRAGGLFVWATTALDFIENGLDPENTLCSILTGNIGSKSNGLGSLYKQVLKISLDGLEAYEVNAVRNVTGVIVLAKILLHQSDLERFLCNKFSLPDLGR